jgi:hypothetical protein
MNNLSLEGAKPTHSRRFLARLEKQLVSQADPEVGAVRRQPFAEKIPEPGLAQLAGAVTEGPDAGNDERVALGRLVRSTGKNACSAGMLEGTLDAA